jgi:hypothetical protein
MRGRSIRSLTLRIKLRPYKDVLLGPARLRQKK